jgi:hypothetical protein
MPRHRKFYCASECSDDDDCVQDNVNCGFGYDQCKAPFGDDLGEVFVLSGNLCDDSDCPQDDYEEECDDLCDEDTLSECPEIIHCEEVKRPKKYKKGGRCGECGYAKCKCDEVDDWSVILCDEEGVYDESCCDDMCSTPITPCAPCNIGVRVNFHDGKDEDSCMPKKSQPKCDVKEKCKDKKLVLKPNCPKKCEDNGEKSKTRESEGDCSGCAYPVSNCRCKNDSSDSKTKGRVIKISFVNKNSHPQKHRIVSTDYCIAVNGVAGDAIHMVRGNRYLIEIEGSDEFNFYFTKDMMGGPIGEAASPSTFDPVQLRNSFSPTQGKVILFKADDSVPKRFYYQSKTNRCMGSDVYVHSNRN